MNTFNAVQFSGSISREAFFRVQTLLLLIWVRWYVFSACIVYFFVRFGVGWTEVISSPMNALPDLILAALVLLASNLIVWFGRNKAWRNTIAMSGRVFGVVTESGIDWNTSNTVSKFEWLKFVKVRLERNLTMLFYSERCALYFPKSFFESEQEWLQFDSLVSSRVFK